MPRKPLTKAQRSESALRSIAARWSRLQGTARVEATAAARAASPVGKKITKASI